MSQRDGSLIRRKQEQWAREREEEKNSAWFPFGAPGCGSPNRKYYPRGEEVPASGSQNSVSSGGNSSSKHVGASSQGSHSSTDYYSREETIRHEAQPRQQQAPEHVPVASVRRPSFDMAANPDSAPQSAPPLFCANPLLPYQMSAYGGPWMQHPQAMHHGMQQTMASMPYIYNVLPPGTIPIPVQVVSDSLQNGEPICPVTVLQNMQNMTQMAPPVPGIPIVAIPPTNNSYHQEELNKTISANEVSSSLASISLGSSTSGGSRPSTGERNVEPTPTPRPRGDHEKLERERIEREIMEKREREEEEKRLAEQREEELRKSLDRRHNAVLEALERAQREAEVMKKARLYKHVIEGSEEKPELERKLLGVDSETGEEVLKQVSQFERQRKYENDALPKKKTAKQGTTDINANQIPPRPATRSRASSMSGNDSSGVPTQPSPLSRSAIGRSSLRTPTRRNSSAGKENIKWNSNENISSSSTPTKPAATPPVTVTDTFVIKRSIKTVEQTTPSSTSPLGSANRSIGVPPPRPSALNSIRDVLNPLFSPISTRSRRMRPTSDSPIVAAAIGKGSDGTSSSSTSPAQSPVPQIRIESDKSLNAAEEVLTKLRSRSVASSPAYTSPAGRASPLASSIYAKRIAEKGCTNHDEDLLAPDVRRRAEANLSRQSSMASLKGSLCNLRGSFSNLSSAGEDSPNLSKYRSMNPAYRSFNMKKTSDRQKDTLDRLARLREQLRAKENFMDRGLSSRNGSNLSVRQ